MATIESGTSLESATPVDASTPIITEGCYAVVRKVGGEHTRVVRLTNNTNVLIEKLRFEAESAIGNPFGLFEVIGKRLVPASVEDLKKRDGVEDIEMAEVGPMNGKDEIMAPSALNVDTRQKMTAEDITEMKDGGGTAGDVVSKLVAGNASFAGRTVYAKSKYIRRKTKKHSDRVFILRPTIRLVCEAYLRKDHDKAGSLRVDQLGQIIHLGAIHTGRKVVVFDQVLGIVTASTVERLAGNGACIHLHRGTIAQSIPCLNSMNFKAEILSTFYPVRIESVLNGCKQVEEEGKGEKDEEMNGGKTVNENMNGEHPGIVKKAERLAREVEGLNILVQGIETILIATRSVCPISILEVLWPRLKAAGTVVVYSPTVEHCLRAQQWIRKEGAVNVTLSDQMYRVQQVLPHRTHPLMSQMIVGGYVLSAIKVLPAPPTTN